ncbi:MAG TPA: cytochrome c family protein [Anaerohalosphaeraceae bacterium]|jgi:hypothetical protein|nr:cytochrome c family protein [Anaerohalosphaeraceae bacterium]HRT49980.1 cytochrome c family protein [Anaerohalosphaeraceae bacterium]HRT85722.1 cytochrome c family protein [Anaerohalosphaeraceae bacterium]
MKSYLVLLLLILAVCVGCTPSRSPNETTSAPKPGPPADTITVFMTGNILSTLQPCGCSSGQLGGFDRRGAVLATAPAERRLIVDTGNLLAGDGPQDIIKSGIMMQAMAMLHYDVANLTPKDLATVTSAGMAEGNAFALITPGGKGETGLEAAFSKQFEIAGKTLAVSVASVHAEAIDLSSVRSLFKTHDSDLTLNILIVDDGSDDLRALLEGFEGLDVVVCPAAADEPRIVDAKRRKPLFVSVGRLGKYVARLTARPTEDGELKLAFDKIAVDESLHQDQNLVQLYKDYQLMLKEERLLEKHPRVPLPGGLKYLGSDTCRSCHDYEYEKWSTNAHAHAYETLVKVGSQHDPECVRCHVVGFGYESGFITEESAQDLRDVGCEVCHGPGSDHFKAMTSGRADTGIAQPQAGCVDCHNPDHSPGYQGHEAEFLQKIVHWREPKAADDVK